MVVCFWMMCSVVSLRIVNYFLRFPEYTPARKDYIYKFLFSELISRNFTCQLHENILLELNFPTITHHVFVGDSRNYMEKLVGNFFLENRISVTQKNVFGISFAIISDWSVRLVKAGHHWLKNGKLSLKIGEFSLKIRKFSLRIG